MSETFIWTHNQHFQHFQHFQVMETWIGESNLSDGKSIKHEVINPLIFHFISEIVLKQHVIFDQRLPSNKMLSSIRYVFKQNVIFGQRLSLNKMLSSMCKASAVIELWFFSKGDVWSVVISFFLVVFGIYIPFDRN